MERTPQPEAQPSAATSLDAVPVAASPPRKWPVIALLVVISLLLLAVAAVLMNSDGRQTVKTGGPAPDVPSRAVSSGDNQTQRPTSHPTAPATPPVPEKPKPSPPTSADPSKPQADADPSEFEGITVLVLTLDKWRQETTALMREDVAAGWTKSRFEPAKIVAPFELLKVKKGYALRAYQFREEANGNGVVWAMPENAGFPEPKECLVLANHLFKAPKPARALDDVMEAITGDGTPLSYMAASILRRQFSEFGASGHGCDWGIRAILEHDPWKATPAKEGRPPLDISPGNRDSWKWLAVEPKYWPPQVRVEKDQVKVIFYTYTNLEKQRIFRHTDTYRPGDYCAKSEDKPIAEGPPGPAI